MSDQDVHDWHKRVFALCEPAPIPTLDIEQVDDDGNVIRAWRLTSVTMRIVPVETENE